jgi:hypothetical protein
VDSNPDPSFGIADSNDATLAQFFARPIKIASYEWLPGASFYQSIYPWQSFFENPRVINRISNFNLLRCKLNVKFLINGSSFHYGRLIASYWPLDLDDSFTTDRAPISRDLIFSSQRPHIYLDPTNSQGGTLSLPFVWYKNALSIPSQEWRRMGSMTLRAMNLLKHANGGTDGVIISVFVWAEDVVLSIPTSVEPASLAPQIGEYVPQTGDEYGNGVISKPAGVIAKVSGALSNIPGISAYARATEMAANAVSSIATMFGYSRPIVLADILPYKPTYVGNLANTNVPDTSQKLTLDAKQELTIDPRVVGLSSVDELSIKSIATREAYLTTFNWAVGAPIEGLLWNAEVLQSYGIRILLKSFYLPVVLQHYHLQIGGVQ